MYSRYRSTKVSYLTMQDLEWFNHLPAKRGKEKKTQRKTRFRLSAVGQASRATYCMANAPAPSGLPKRRQDDVWCSKRAHSEECPWAFDFVPS